VPVAERTYRGWKRAQPSQRDIDDAHLIEAIRAARVNDRGEATPESLYGRRKMTALLRRRGIAASSRRVDRVMRELGIRGLVRGRGVRTTVPDPAATRAPDLLDRDFTAVAPNSRWVADFTYVRTWAGFVYVAFVVDCFSRAIVGWHAATTKTTPLVTTALRMALWRRDRAGHHVGEGLVHHSDAGSQGGFNRSSQHLEQGGVQRWRRRTGARRPATCRRVCVGSGVRIGRCGHRCVRPGGRSPRGRCTGSSGG